MAKAKLKTQKTKASVDKFIGGIDDEHRREDCLAVIEIMKKITKCEPAMWGKNIVGFGSYCYKYASGHEGEWPLTGVSPRKREISIYVMPYSDGHETLLKKLGNIKHGKSCLYVKSLEDIHLPTLRQMIKRSVAHIKKMYKT